MLNGTQIQKKSTFRIVFYIRTDFRRNDFKQTVLFLEIHSPLDWTSRESLWLPAIGIWGYPIRAYKWLGAISVMFHVCMASGPHSSISEEFLHYNSQA